MRWPLASGTKLSVLSCSVPVVLCLPSGTRATPPAHKNLTENQGTNVNSTSATNNAAICGQTRGIATSGDTRPIAQAA
ncbi:exported hypothetical protein [Cupriavidus taiwanensis]|uniref:Uncharacterized protein n=1 Tax=Cupriavidus taiwanensis TaxID=164546 RepID=A0A375BSB7_9BURK|nr:exported hypothetical protein [Cupriavidus taiwanensis]